MACPCFSIALAGIPLKSVFNYTDFLAEVLLTSLEEDGQRRMKTDGGDKNEEERESQKGPKEVDRHRNKE